MKVLLCSYLRLFWLSWFSCNSVLIFQISLSIYKEVSWDSDRDCAEPAKEVGEYYHFNNVKSSYSWRWGIFSTYLDFFFFRNICLSFGISVLLASLKQNDTVISIWFIFMNVSKGVCCSFNILYFCSYFWILLKKYNFFSI